MKPTSLPKLLSATLIVTVCFLLPGQAAARFGKSGGGGSSGGSSGGHTSSGGGSNYHTASPRSSGSYSNPGSGYYPGTPGGGYGAGAYTYGYNYAPYYSSCWQDPYCSPYRWGYGYRPYWGLGFYGPQPVYESSSVEVAQQQELQPVTTVALEGQSYRSGGAGFGANLGIEKGRWGLEGRYTGIFAPSQDSAVRTDAIHLFDMHATYAVVASPHGRLKLGAGVDSAFAPNVTFVGPALFASGALGLFGPVGLEGSIDWVPWPFTKVDFNAGLAVGLGPFGIRGGWRRIYLNDNGYVDPGISHVDIFSGPYVSVGIAL